MTKLIAAFPNFANMSKEFPGCIYETFDITTEVAWGVICDYNKNSSRNVDAMLQYSYWFCFFISFFRVTHIHVFFILFFIHTIVLFQP